MENKLQTLFERIKNLPEEPGCYLMKNAQGHIFYIGKAINLRARVLNYFNGSDNRAFVSFLSDILAEIDTIVVRNQSESLLLERALIKKHQPEYNVLLKDDKNYILLRLAVQKSETKFAKHLRYPRLEIVRKAKNDQAQYFGPYPSANHLRTTLRLINKFFRLRTCGDKVIDNRSRPCIQYQIGRCPAPCVQEITNYQQEMSNVALFLQGQTEEILLRLKKQMWQAAHDEHFENAAHLRDQINAVKTSLIKQAVSSSTLIDQDIFGAFLRNGFLALSQLKVRKGSLIGHTNQVFSTHNFPVAELLSSYLSQNYLPLEKNDLPQEILLDSNFSDENQALAALLSERTGSNIKFLAPQRGKKNDLVKIAQRNAQVALEEELRKLLTQNSSLVALKNFLDLSELPKVIECFDISLFQGTDAVASKVCFVDGKADKTRYRQYNIKSVEGMNDFAMLYEAISRRLKRGIIDDDLPNLLLVDGGKGQLNAALQACHDSKIDLLQHKMTVAGIAKSRVEKNTGADLRRSAERIFLASESEARMLPEHSAEKHLVERIRDEAHRFAIERHRKRRSARTFSSALDSIPGIGAQRRKMLLRHFGSIKEISKASVEELCQVKGISKELAESIVRNLSD